MKNLVILLISICFAGSLRAQQLNVKTGSEFTVETDHNYVLTIDNRGSYKRDGSYTFRFKLLSSDAQGYKLSCTLYKAKMWNNLSTSGIFTFNSDSIRRSSLHTSAVLMPFILLEQPFTVLLSPNGKLIKLEGIDQLINKAAAKWTLTESTRTYNTANLPGSVLSLIKDIFLELPTEKISYGSAWTNTSTNTTYKVTAIAGALLSINASAADTIQAKYSFNEVNGLPEDVTIARKKQSDGASEQWHYTHKVIYDKHLTATADTAWANMAVMLSFMNDAIRPTTNRTVDSAMAFSYFKKYDPLYADDPYYISQKLSLVNQMGHFDNGVYRKLVLKTPNKFLAETELQNKMNYVMDTDIDQIYDLVKYRYKSPAFDDWLQGSLNFSLLTHNRGTHEEQVSFHIGNGKTAKQAEELALVQEKNLANCIRLLERMHNDKDPIIQQKVNAMYLWSNAYNNDKNDEVLTRTADQFLMLTDAYMKAGNGGRYGLLIYNILVEAGLTESADAVLDKTVTDLERYLPDTAYTNGTYTATRAKYAAQNILMDIYYLKYKKWEKTDTLKALGYLAKAAQYSPVDISEQASASYADRMIFKILLGLDQSYRAPYIEKLFAQGATNAAMKMFATNIKADLESLGDMQKIYQQRFPDKKFGDFVKDNIIAYWDEAPFFSNKDIKGRTYSLADYKGKWLVLDFWGTWCGPCRMEMPNVEEFNKEIIAGKHPGIELLGVATMDTETSLKKYFNETKATLNTVLQDEGFDRYDIKAVPTKCLIAPNGKMVMLQSGADWRGVVKKLNELYAAN